MTKKLPKVKKPPKPKPAKPTPLLDDDSGNGPTPPDDGG